MDTSEMKLVIEAALLAAGKPLPFEKLVEIFTRKGDAPDRAAIREALDALAADYAERRIELKEVGSGFRIQVRSSMADWLQPLWEERAPRYTRALLETLALIAYRQPITRSEIEEVRGVAVSSNIVRTLMERGWVRVVGHREVPGKPAMLGTTREFLDYFGLKKLEDLPDLAEFNEEHPQMSPQSDFLDSLGGEEEVDAGMFVDEAEAGDGTAVPLAAVPGPAPEGDAARAEDDGGIVAFAELAANDGEGTADSVAPAADDRADGSGEARPVEAGAARDDAAGEDAGGHDRAEGGASPQQDADEPPVPSDGDATAAERDPPKQSESGGL